MRQELNLLTSDLLPPKERLPLWQLGMGLAAWLVLLGGVSVHDQWRISGSAAELTVRSEQAQAAERAATRLTADHDAHSERARLNREVGRLIGTRGEREALLQLLEQETGAGARTPFSRYFAGLADAHVPGLWITALRIDLDAGTLQISGAAQQPARVPGFVTELRAIPAFAGARVHGLELRAIEPDSVGFELRGAPG